MARYMLDTDTCSYIMKRSHPTLLRRLQAVPVADVCMSVITKAELLFGVEVSPVGLEWGAYLDRLRATYQDPDLAWGDAAVPDDTTWIAETLRLLTADTETRKRGLPVLDIALALGRSEAEVRELVKPQKRSAGLPMAAPSSAFRSPVAT